MISASLANDAVGNHYALGYNNKMIGASKYHFINKKGDKTEIEGHNFPERLKIFLDIIFILYFLLTKNRVIYLI